MYGSGIALKKMIFLLCLLFFSFIYLITFTNFYSYPAIYIHFFEKSAGFEVSLEDTNADYKILKSNDDGVVKLLPKYPPYQVPKDIPEAGLYIYWGYEGGQIKSVKELNLKAAEMNFCTMDIYLNDSYLVVDTQQDNSQGFACLKKVVKRNFLNP